MSNNALTITPLPLFSQIKTQSIAETLQQKLEDNRRVIAALVAENQTLDWDHFVAELETISDELDSLWSPISHLNAVKNDDAIRAVYKQCLAWLTQYGSELGQHQGLYRGFRQIADSEQYAQLNQAQRKLVDNMLRDFHLSGIDLPEKKQQRYQQIKSRLAELSSQFSDNVLDATQGWHKQVTDRDQLHGLPATALNNAAQAAKSKNLPGWLFTLDIPSYLPVMQYCDNEALREELYVAYCTRASDQGPNAGKWDNGPLMEEILSLRQELARLLGYKNYACLSLATKMAESPRQVLDFLNDLAEKSRPVAVQEFAQLCQFAEETAGKKTLQSWDVAYYSEKLREARYALSQEELRPYFPAETVIHGLFAVVQKLFGIDCRPHTAFDSYHEDIQLFDIVRNDQLIAHFYLDIYARENKRGGAWMADCRSRRRLADGSLQKPVAFLTCNFTPPSEQQPSLLTHQEVTTLFHEFGHGLHHMLTQVEVTGVAGINGVEWDAVELPSQFLENWCWEEEAISLISSHYQTGEALPAVMLEKLLAARNFQSGMQMARQLEFALFDFHLHAEYEHPVQQDIQKLLDRVRQEVSVVPTPAFNRFQHGFSHIFAGGYAAGYYSYKWAELLAADAFSLFEEQGVFNAETGRQFLTEILQQGGSQDAMTLFVNYRGRKPEVEALLRHCGIAR